MIVKYVQHTDFEGNALATFAIEFRRADSLLGTGREWRLDGNRWIELETRGSVLHDLWAEVGYDEIPEPEVALPAELLL